MRKMIRRVVAFAAAVVFAASETLPAAELTHRWRFNGDYSDSAGGADAVKCGTYVSLYGGRDFVGTVPAWWQFWSRKGEILQDNLNGGKNNG